VSSNQFGHHGDRARQVLIGYKPVAETGGLSTFPVGLSKSFLCPIGAVTTGEETSTQGGIEGVNKYAKGIWVAV
jgi:hypothetical protein